MRRPLRLWLRSPPVFWVAASCLALGTVFIIGARQADLDRRERRLGSLVEVVVVVGDHTAGSALGPENARLVEVPEAMVTDDALRKLPSGQRLVSDVSDGEVLTRHRMADGHPSALAAVVADGWRAVAVGLPPAGLKLEAGDRVDLLALTGAGTSTVIVRDAVVLAGSDEAATISVPRADAAAVADAALTATLTVTLVGPGA